MTTKRSTGKSYATKSMTIANAVISIANTNWGWASTDLARANRAVISARTAGVMITWSGVDPTTSLGHPIQTNEWAAIEHQGDIAQIKLIREGSTSAVVTITLEK